MERLASNLNYAKRVLSGQYKEFNPEVTIDELKNEVIPHQQKILDTLKAEHVSSKVLFDWLYEFICEGESKEIFGDYFYVSERNGLIYESARDVPSCIRLRGFPEIELHSLEETNEFMKTRDDFEYYLGREKDAKEELKKFWTKYPNGLIYYC
jgi:hypothetical protein